MANKKISVSEPVKPIHEFALIADHEFVGWFETEEKAINYLKEQGSEFAYYRAVSLLKLIDNYELIVTKVKK